NVLADAFAAAAEMQHRRRRNGHLRRDLGVLLQEPEVIDEGVAVEMQLAGDAHAARLRLDPGELDAVFGLVAFDAAKALQEVEMPPGAPILGVRSDLHADLFLLPDQLLDLDVLD